MGKERFLPQAAELPPRGLRPLLVLIVGFGGLIIFILAAAVGTVIQLDRVRADDTRIRQDFTARLRSLEQIRSQIYLSSTDVRDFLLSPDAGDAARQRADILSIQEQIRRALDRYAPSVEPEEQDAFQALRSEIDGWWQVLQTAFDWSAAERNRQRYTFFYEQLVPRRTTMLQIADRIAEINEAGLNRAEDRLAASAVNLRWSLLVTFGVVLFGGILLAVGTIGLTLRLEREVEKRLRETTDARADLRELSARLVRAQEEERRTLARELHDEVGQSLSAIMMEANSLEESQSGAVLHPQEVRERLVSIGAIAAKTLNVVRDLALLLRPSMLDDFGLVPALNWQARETGKRTGLNVRVTADETSDDLPEEHKTCIYRLAQEALNNAARHASARNIRVAVKTDPGLVRFSVQDDGTGFDKRVVRGLGLLGMEERVRRLGGKLWIDSQPGRGTTISAELPLPEMTLPDEIADESHAANSHIAG
jgi:signal transduction histidine kinase